MPRTLTRGLTSFRRRKSGALMSDFGPDLGQGRQSRDAGNGLGPAPLLLRAILSIFGFRKNLKLAWGNGAYGRAVLASCLVLLDLNAVGAMLIPILGSVHDPHDGQHHRHLDQHADDSGEGGA